MPPPELEQRIKKVIPEIKAKILAKTAEFPEKIFANIHAIYYILKELTVVFLEFLSRPKNFGAIMAFSPIIQSLKELNEFYPVLATSINFIRFLDEIFMSRDCKNVNEKKKEEFILATIQFFKTEEISIFFLADKLISLFPEEAQKLFAYLSIKYIIPDLVPNLQRNENHFSMLMEKILLFPNYNPIPFFNSVIYYSGLKISDVEDGQMKNQNQLVKYFEKHLGNMNPEFLVFFLEALKMNFEKTLKFYFNTESIEDLQNENPVEALNQVFAHNIKIPPILEIAKQCKMDNTVPSIKEFICLVLLKLFIEIVGADFIKKHEEEKLNEEWLLE